MHLIQQIKALRHKAYLAFCRALPIQQNKVILWADNFKSFGCSPKYLALHLAGQYPGKFDIVWVLERDKPLPEGLPREIRVVRYFSMEYLREIATAKVVVCNHRTGIYHYFRKRKGQFYIQTWHSSLRLKQIEGDVPGLPESYVAAAKADSQQIDLLLSGCRFSTEIFRRAFWYGGEILECGTPRCDIFFRDPAPIKAAVYRRFGIPQGRKLALYAPTFRKDQAPSLYGMDLDGLQEFLGDTWCVGCRLHPNLNGSVPTGAAIPMSGYPDMQELLAACDLLITDYSSSMFDMAVAGKPCILYVPDLAAYTSGDRGLYFDIQALPFPKATDMAQVYARIRHFDSGAYQQALTQFAAQTGNRETGSAAAAVAQRICRICGSP